MVENFSTRDVFQSYKRYNAFAVIDPEHKSAVSSKDVIGAVGVGIKGFRGWSCFKKTCVVVRVYWRM